MSMKGFSVPTTTPIRHAWYFASFDRRHWESEVGKLDWDEAGRLWRFTPKPGVPPCGPWLTLAVAQVAIDRIVPQS